MNINDMFPSKYLSQKDVPQPQVFTIQGFTQEDVTDKGMKVKKNVLLLAGTKPWILNKGNASRLAALFGSSTDSWMGRQIEVYTDPMVEMGGKVVGGLRVRAPSQPAPQQQPAAAPQPAPQPASAGTWDVKDPDGNVLYYQTGAQVFALVASGANPDTLMVKPSDKGREAVKTAREYGFAPGPAQAADPIPW